MAGQLLAEQGHEAMLHARNVGRTEDVRRALPQTKVVLGDLPSPQIPAV
jgi:hypothetical protein